MNSSGSIVADITTSRKSRRRSATSFSSPSSMSVATCRSCTSSMITSEYRSSLLSNPPMLYRGSDCSCFSNTPSVTNFSFRPLPLLSKRIWYPTYARHRCQTSRPPSPRNTSPSPHARSATPSTGAAAACTRCGSSRHRSGTVAPACSSRSPCRRR